MDPLQRLNTIQKYNFTPLIENLDATVSIVSSQITVCFVNPNAQHLFCRQYSIANEVLSGLTTADSVKLHVLSLADLEDFAIKAKYSFDNFTVDVNTSDTGHE